MSEITIYSANIERMSQTSARVLHVTTYSVMMPATHVRRTQSNIEYNATKQTTE